VNGKPHFFLDQNYMTTTSVLVTEPCTHNLLHIGSEITIDENDIHVGNGWNEGRCVVELDVMTREMYCSV